MSDRSIAATVHRLDVGAGPAAATRHRGAASGATPAAPRAPSARRSAAAGVAAGRVLGGAPVRTRAVSGWPVADAREEQALTAVLRSGKWGRGDGEQVERFERAYAALTGATHCLATANGTSALLTVARRARRRPGRRGDRPALHVRRDRQRRAAAARAAGVRRHRHRDLPDRRAQDRGGDHRRARARSCPCTSADRPPTSTRSCRRAAPRRARAGGRLPGAPRRVEGPQGRHARPAPAASASRRARTSTPAKAARIVTDDAAFAGDLLHVPQQQPRPRDHRRRLLLSRHRRRTCA